MKKMTTDEVIEFLQVFRKNDNVTLETLQSPNYPLYATAPYWLPHQTICLLAEIATIDEETFRQLIHLQGIQLDIQKRMHMI